MMFTSLKNRTKGFTLIELLVVIAIIGILSSVVLASLSTARQKSRDAKRISDVGQIQLALELFYDANQTYPAKGASPYAVPASLAAAATQYLPKIPTSPSGTDYIYAGLASATSLDSVCTTSCLSYGIFAVLERIDNVVLGGDADMQTITTAPLIIGNSVACTNTAGVPYGTVNNTEQCYDLKP